MNRRQFVIGTGAAAGALACAHRPVAGASPLAALERAQGGRLGVVAIDLGSGRRLEHRPDERFPLCSTFKTSLAAAILARNGKAGLGRSLRYTSAELLEYAPATRENLGRGEMTLGELCAAAVTLSDNTAANLLLGDLGGLAPFNAYLRSLGDAATRLDRVEPALNEALPGDPRDTTTPRAMAEDLRRLFLDDTLSPEARAQLVDWHRQTRTGPDRLRAGLPPSWPLAHKTGTGHHGAMNDIGVAWPPGRAPVVVAAYYAEREAPTPVLEAVLAEVARIVGRTCN